MYPTFIGGNPALASPVWWTTGGVAGSLVHELLTVERFAILIVVILLLTVVLPVVVVLTWYYGLVAGFREFAALYGVGG